jgi:hypothetical protein
MTVHAALQERPMNTPIKTRVAAFVAAILVTLANIYVLADYAYPEAPATRVAFAAR